MEKNLQIFIEFLDKSIVDIEQEILIRASKRVVKELLPEDEKDLLKITERKNIRRILSVPREEWDLHGEIYIQFDYLSDMLEESSLNARGMFSIIFRLLEKNLSTNITNQDARCFDIQQIDNYEFKYMSRDEFLEFVRTDEYGRLKTKDELDLTENEKKRLEEFNTYSELYPLDIAPIIDAHKLMKKHYFDKLESFTIEDIEIFLEQLRVFKLSDNLSVIFRNLLVREIEKRQRREEVVSIPEIKPVVETKAVMNKKQYNLIERELRKYFDLSIMEVVSPLTLDLQIYCVGLLLKLGVSEDKIREILRIMNKDGYSYDNPISMFVALQEKLEYYKDVEGVSEAIKTMVGVMSEITFGTDVDYEEWKAFLSSELDNTLKLIPKTYDYEIEKAKKGNK